MIRRAERSARLPSTPADPAVPQPVKRAIDGWEHANILRARRRFTDAKKAIKTVPVRTGTPPRANEVYAAALQRLIDVPSSKPSFGPNEQRRLLETAIRYSVVDETGFGAPHTQALSLPGHLGALPADVPLADIVAPQRKQRMLQALLALRLADPAAKALMCELMKINLEHGGVPTELPAQQALMRTFFAHHHGADPIEFQALALPVLEQWLRTNTDPGLAGTFVDEMDRQGRPLALMNDANLRTTMFGLVARGKAAPGLPAGVQPQQTPSTPVAMTSVPAIHVSPPEREENQESSSASDKEGPSGDSAHSSARDASEASTASSKTILRTDVMDVLNRPSEIHIKAGGMKRLLESVGEAWHPVVRMVIDQAKASGQITKLEEATGTSDGLVSFPVNFSGQEHTAFLTFGQDGRVRTLDISDAAFVQLFEAVDTLAMPNTSTSVSAATSARMPTFTPLTPPAGLTPRVDISNHVQRKDQGSGVVRYGYQPQPGDVTHSIQVDAWPDATLFLQHIAARPELSATLGSGTDMVLGMAKRLNADGVQVRQIQAAWVNQQGVDSQYMAFEQSRAQGLSAQDAAMGTFSGKVARMFGFTEVGISKSFYGNYDVRFAVPGARSGEDANHRCAQRSHADTR